MSVEFALTTLKQYSKEIAEQMSKYEDYKISCKTTEKPESSVSILQEIHKCPSYLTKNKRIQALITLANFELPERIKIKEFYEKTYNFVMTRIVKAHVS